NYRRGRTIRAFDLKRAAREGLSLVAYFFLTLSSGNFLPLSLPLLAANIYVGFNPITGAILCFLPFLLSRSAIVVLCGGWGVLILSLSLALLRRRDKKPVFSLLPLTAAAVAPYAAFTNFYNLALRIGLSASLVPLSFLMISAVRATMIKGLKYKLSIDELISSALLVFLVGTGAINALGADFWKLIAIFVTLLSAYVAPYGYGAFPAIVFSFPLAAQAFSPSPIAVFCLFSLAAACFKNFSKLLVALSVVATELALFYFTGIYGDAPAYSLLFCLLPSTAFAFIPEKFYDGIKEKLKIYRSPNLGRYAVNKTRAATADKLFITAEVFGEMAASIKQRGEAAPSEISVKRKIASEIVATLCPSCPYGKNCEQSRMDINSDMLKTVNIGVAKGKVNLVDLPKTLVARCARPEEVIKSANLSVKDYEKTLSEERAVAEGRELMYCQASGISEALKGLALELSAQAEVNSALENAVYDNLLKCGIFAPEITVFGSGEDAEVNLVVASEAIDSPYFLKAISEKLGYKSIIVGRTNLSEELAAVTVKRVPAFDAAFGIAQKAKSGEKISGDTHSVTKISEGKFLIALSDGMGSGERAEATSAAAVSLIETFYKAGLPSKTVLSIVNKILSFSKEENFSAIDVGIVDLFVGKADFIKIGSPYSFIITRDSVKIIEGSSLPLGILDEMKPTVLKTALGDGDMIVFVSDGISDAFGSAADIIDFLSTQRAFNPKTLADDILSKALILSDGRAKDDMTAFCVRIFT
ncbi:MAG: SpoIIE family protein phosphatase, partial [Clostridia bacterium]|nr:SpoIIE family protein phosphatase [Clostridia bacterium]